MKVVVFMGTVRDSTPPRPARLGARVAKACAAQLGGDAEVTVVDPLEVELPVPFKASSEGVGASRLQA